MGEVVVICDIRAGLGLRFVRYLRCSLKAAAALGRKLLPGIAWGRLADFTNLTLAQPLNRSICPRFLPSRLPNKLPSHILQYKK